MRFATRNGVRLHVKVMGEPAREASALLIHGLNANIAFWHPGLLRGLNQVRNLIMYDQRGHGYSDLPKNGYTPTDLAEDAASVLDEAGASQVDVIAHSFGTVVALRLAALQPHRVRSLTILDGRIRLLQPASRLGDWKQFDRWRRHFEHSGIRLTPDMEIDFKLPLYLADANLEEIGKLLAEDGFFVQSRGERAAAKYRRLLTETSASRDFHEQAGLHLETIQGLKAPTLALYGSHSPFLPTMEGLLREVPGCRAGKIEGGGHNFPFMKPEETQRAILGFWHSLPPATG